MLEDHEIMAREPDLERLRHAYVLLQTDHSHAIAELEKLASAGSVMSALYLADSFARGPNIDAEKTEKWFKFAYEHGSERGLVFLAAHYAQSGRYADAEKLYLEGVSKNDGPSTYYLAKLYIKTRRYDVATPEIKSLLEKAAALGQAKAMRDLWLLHIKGTFGILNIPKGIFLFFYYLSRSFKMTISDRHADAYGPYDKKLW